MSPSQRREIKVSWLSHGGLFSDAACVMPCTTHSENVRECRGPGTSAVCRFDGDDRGAGGQPPTELATEWMR